MKKVILIVFVLLALGACGSKNHSAENTQMSTSTTSQIALVTEQSRGLWDGSWEAVDDEGDTRFVVDIATDKVEIYWNVTGDAQIAYWYGSFTKVGDDYVSHPDVEAMANLTSTTEQEPVVTFLNKGNTLEFTTNSVGVTKTFHLERM